MSPFSVFFKANLGRKSFWAFRTDGKTDKTHKTETWQSFTHKMDEICQRGIMEESRILVEDIVDLVKIDIGDVDEKLNDELFAENMFQGSTFCRF